MLKHAECILVAAEQAALRASLARLLRPLGYRVEVASTGKVARQLLTKERFAAALVAPAGLAACDPAFLNDVQNAVQKLVLLGNNKNDAKGFAVSVPEALVCNAERLQQDQLLTFLSSLTSPPASVQENSSPVELLHFAECTLDVTGRTFLNAERQEVALTRGEFNLLVALARNARRVLSRSQLRAAIDGGGADADDRSIDMLVARLRRKIESDRSNPKLIITVPGAGYKFAAVVRREHLLANTDPIGNSIAQGRRNPERRQLTILSCQVLGFAALFSKLDPEVLDDRTCLVWASCSETINRLGGTIIRIVGDELLAYFGHPNASEHDAENAVRASLELVRTIGCIEVPPTGRLGTRIGLATGLKRFPSDLNRWDSQRVTDERVFVH
jgi:DNA-binding response OmpR family regulator